MDNLEEILAALREGKTLSKDQTGYLIDSLSKVSAGKKPADTNMSLSDFESGLMSAIDAVRKSPEGQANLKESIAERRTQRFTKRYMPFFNAVLSGADIAQSLKQVRSSNNLLRNQVRPALPSVPGIDPALDQAIRGAQQTTQDQARVLGPARQELQDQYGKDIALSKAVGEGQASTLGALGQVAAMRRARGAAGLIPLADSVRAREQGRLDNLIGMRQQQANQNYYDRFRNANLALDQYNQNVAAAGGLGSVGRLNLRNSVQSLLASAPGVIARTANNYGDKYSQYENYLNNSLTGNRRPQEPMNNPIPQYNASDYFKADPYLDSWY